jgi:hypothetical protein
MPDSVNFLLVHPAFVVRRDMASSAGLLWRKKDNRVGGVPTLKLAAGAAVRKPILILNMDLTGTVT